MNRCYIEPEQFRTGSFRIEGEDARHLLRVLRIRTGATIEIFDGLGHAREAVVRETGRHSLLAEADASRPPRFDPIPECRVTLVPAVIRPNRMDWTIEKGVELGMHGLWPFCSARSRPNKPGVESPRRIARIRRIVIESARQSGRCRLPEVAPLERLKVVLDRCAELEVLLVGSLAPGAQPMNRVLNAFTRLPRSLGILIGPEGDLTPEELCRVEQAGAVPVNLAKTVLRAETAAVSALSMVQGFLADRDFPGNGSLKSS